MPVGTGPVQPIPKPPAFHRLSDRQVEWRFRRLRAQIHEEGMAILRDAGRARSRPAMARIAERLRALTEVVDEVAWRCRDRDPEDWRPRLLGRLS